MGQALYRKHRSRSLDEIVGQEHITDTLRQAIKQGRISHAYLLTGPKGVGKTSIARILAHEINELPYEDDSVHIDIIEIDAASNRRIDEIRELRDRVYVAPTSAKYKVYIIDEVHMLTREAFNALLKTLEEPPAHVVFILATTDAHKLPETIVSRTQRYNFKPVEKSKVITHLQSIAKTEGIEISQDALALLAEHGEGSFRDSISMLDQARSTKQNVEIEDVQTLLGLPSEQSISALVELLSSGGSSAQIMQSLESLYESGYQPSVIARQISKKLKGLLVEGNSAWDSESILTIIGELIEVPGSSDPQSYLEIVLLKKAKSVPVSAPSKTVIETSVAEIETVELKPDIKPNSPAKSLKLDETVWPKILAALKQKHNTLYGVVRMAQPSFEEEGIVKLSFAFAFHQKRSSESSNQKRLASIINELTGQDVRVDCILDTNAKPPKIAVKIDKKSDGQALAAISNIFGEAELLES